MPEERAAEIDGVVDQVDAVEERPLAERAAGYAALQEQLRAHLEGGSGSR